MRNARLTSIALLFLMAAFCQSGFAVWRTAMHARLRSRATKTVSPHQAGGNAKSEIKGRHGDPPPTHLRDPFAPLLADQPKQGKDVARPPGKAGLSIDEIVVQGTVTGPHGAVAVVSSPDGHVYFLRVGDQLFDGTVEKIELNQVVFVQHARDAFGRKFGRLVAKPVQPPEGAKP